MSTEPEFNFSGYVAGVSRDLASEFQWEPGRRSEVEARMRDCLKRTGNLGPLEYICDRDPGGGRFRLKGAGGGPYGLRLVDTAAAPDVARVNAITERLNLLLEACRTDY